VNNEVEEIHNHLESVRKFITFVTAILLLGNAAGNIILHNHIGELEKKLNEQKLSRQGTQPR